MIITISRENGSGGRYIAERLSKILQIPFYDKDLVAEAARSGNLNLTDAVENDERSSSSYLEGKSLYKGIFSRVTLDDELFQLESDVIRKVAKQDRRRAVYQEYHTGHAWGSRDDYDLCMDTGKIGVETAAELIAVYYQKKTGGRENA